MARAFVIRPFDKKEDSSGKKIDFEKTHSELIGPALEAAGLGGSTTGEIIDAGNDRPFDSLSQAHRQGYDNCAKCLSGSTR